MKRIGTRSQRKAELRRVAEWLNKPFTESLVAWLLTSGKITSNYFKVGLKTRELELPDDETLEQLADFYNTLLREAYDTKPRPLKSNFDARMLSKELELPAIIMGTENALSEDQAVALAQICVDFRNEVLSINIQNRMIHHMRSAQSRT